MPSTTTTTTKAIAPFKPTAHVSNTTKAVQRIPAPPAPLKVDTSTAGKAPVAGSRAAASQSDEENVRPAQAPAQEPLSPLPLGAKAHERDVRAYEHERQRTKRAGERALNRARKAREDRVEAGARRKTPRGRGAVEVEVDAGVDAVGRAALLVEGLVAAGPGACLGANPIARANARAAQSAGGGVQVDLAELLERSGRKPRKGKEDEFELVPAVRGVIVLDDMPAHAELDEPWEHIERDEGEKEIKETPEPSYAQVVLRAAE